MKLTNDAHATVDEIERLTRQEQDQILQVREAELALQAAQIIVERSKAALERTQHDKSHAFTWLNNLSLMARAGVLRESATAITAEQAVAKRN